MNETPRPAQKRTETTDDTAPVTTATVLSPNQWDFLNREKFRRGRGWNISKLIREALEDHFGQECRDEVGKPGGYPRD